MAVAADLANLLRWEWFRLRRRVGFWVILGLVGLVVIGVLAVMTVLQRAAPLGMALPSYGFPLFVFEALSRMGPFLAVILAAMTFGGDYAWGTLRPLVARGHPRWLAALAKLLLVSIVLGVVWIVAWTLAALVGLALGESAAVFDTVLTTIPGAPDGWGPTAGKFFSAWPAAIAYLGLGAVLCAAGRSTAFGVGVGIAVIIVEAIAYPLANTIAQLAGDVSTSEYTRWTLHGVTGGFMGRDDDWGVWPFAPAIAAYVVGLWALTLAILTRRDLDSGNG